MCFRGKVTMFIGRETKTYILPTKTNHFGFCNGRPLVRQLYLQKNGTAQQQQQHHQFLNRAGVFASVSQMSVSRQLVVDKMFASHFDGIESPSTPMSSFAARCARGRAGVAHPPSDALLRSLSTCPSSLFPQPTPPSQESLGSKVAVVVLLLQPAGHDVQVSQAVEPCGRWSLGTWPAVISSALQLPSSTQTPSPSSAV